MVMHIPNKKILQTDHLLVFEHPQPSYPLHIILMPTRDIPALQDSQPEDSAFFQELIAAAADIIKKKHLDQLGYRLICNGGPNQVFPMLHFHLISENYNPSATQEG